MSDDDLIKEIKEAGGKVFIGFKEPGADRGVDGQGRTLVRPQTIRAGVKDIVSRGADVITEWRAVPAVTAVVSAALVPMLRHLPFVAYIEPALVGHAELASQITPLHISQVGAPSAWSHGSAGAGASILVLDSGKPTHSDIPGVIDAPSPLECRGPDNWGHATAVIGVIKAANNQAGIVGVAPAATVYSAKIKSNYGDTIFYSKIACGLQYGIDIDVDIINMSFEMHSFSELIDDLISAAHSAGILMFAASGNAGPPGGPISVVEYPASHANVIAVGSTTNSGQERASDSQYGADLEFVAPADTILLAAHYDGLPGCPDSASFMWCGGTSYASPAVAAVAALVKGRNPTLSNADIVDRLVLTAVDLGSPGRDIYFGHGLVSAQAAWLGSPSLAGTLEYSGDYPVPNARLTWSIPAGVPTSYKIYSQCRMSDGYTTPWTYHLSVTDTSWLSWDYLDGEAGNRPPSGAYIGYYVKASANIGDSSPSNAIYFEWDDVAEPGC